MVQQELKTGKRRLPKEGYEKLCNFIKNNKNASDSDVVFYAKRENIVCGNGNPVMFFHVNKARDFVASGKVPYSSVDVAAAKAVPLVGDPATAVAAPNIGPLFTVDEKLFIINLLFNSNPPGNIDIARLQKKVLGL